MSRRMGWTIRICFALLWFAVLPLLLEGGAVLYRRWTANGAAAYAQRVRTHGEAWEKLACGLSQASAPVPPASLNPPPDAPKSYLFASLQSEDERQAFVEQTRMLVLCCGPDHGVTKTYIPAVPADINALGRQIAPGTSVLSLVDPGDPQAPTDIRATVETAWKTGQEQCRSYPLAQKDGTSCFVDCNFVPRRDAAGNVSELLVYVTQSMYEKLWFKLRPHVYGGARFLHWTVWTNNLGFRDDEITVPKPAGVFRIACIGASTTFEGPRNDLTYPNLLERRLREHFHTDRIEVINCGVYGLDSAHEKARFQDYLDLQPDLIIHYNFVNDTPGVVAQAYAAEKEQDRAWWSRMRSSAFLSLLFEKWLTPPESRFESVIQNTTMGNMTEMLRLARGHGVPVVLCSTARPDLEHLKGLELDHFRRKYNGLLGPDIFGYARAVDVYNRMIRELAQKEGVEFIPVAEQLTGGTESFIDHCHLYLNGIDRKAQIMFDALRDRIAAMLPGAGGS